MVSRCSHNNPGSDVEFEHTHVVVCVVAVEPYQLVYFLLGAPSTLQRLHRLCLFLGHVGYRVQQHGPHTQGQRCQRGARRQSLNEVVMQPRTHQGADEVLHAATLKGARPARASR